MAAAVDLNHRVGIGWRPELAAGIFPHLDRIDMVEVIADNYFKASRRELDCVCARWPSKCPCNCTASGSDSHLLAVDRRASTRWRGSSNACARQGWSEHLAFVRADGVEIGHLAMPPRTERTSSRPYATSRALAQSPDSAHAREHRHLVRSATEHVQRVRVDARIVRECGAPMLLDLHNLYANAVNAGREPARRSRSSFQLEVVRVGSSCRAACGSPMRTARGDCSTITCTRHRPSCSRCWPRWQTVPQPPSTWFSSATATIQVSGYARGTRPGTGLGACPLQQAGRRCA